MLLVLPSIQELLHISRWPCLGCRLCPHLRNVRDTYNKVPLTVFSMLLTEKVCVCVMVVCTVGFGNHVVAMETLLVGYLGEKFWAVILVGGTPCIGAYFVSPLWSAYAIPYMSSPAPAAGAAAAASLATLSIVSGPSVPVTACAPVTAFAAVVPVSPSILNRPEKLVTVPPSFAVDIIFK